MVMKFFYHKNSKTATRSHRIIIRKSKSNHTANFSLWDCDKDLLELKKLFETILLIEKDVYFKQVFKIQDNWGGNNKGKSHYIIIQEFENNLPVKKSVCIGVELYDFDNDEIKEILSGVFCNKREMMEAMANEKEY